MLPLEVTEHCRIGNVWSHALLQQFPCTGSCSLLVIVSSLAQNVNGGSSDVSLDDQDDDRQQHQVQAAEAMLESHEGKVSLLGGQVHLGEVHVGGVCDEEDDAEADDQAEFEQACLASKLVLVCSMTMVSVQRRLQKITSYDDMTP